MGEQRTATLPFTEGELQAGIDLCDIATKAGGLNVAGAALAIASKFKQALDALPKQTPVEPTDNKS